MDSQALAVRTGAYGMDGKRDVDQLLLTELLPILAPAAEVGLEILDLGAGRGKQVKAIKDLFPKARILAVDANAESLAVIDSLGLPDVETLCLPFDAASLMDRLTAERFHGVLAFFSIYYAKDLNGLLARLSKSLLPGGVMLLVGPGQGNNPELHRIARACGKDDTEECDFLEASELPVADNLHAEVLRWENQLEFQSVLAFRQYFNNFGLYDPEVEDAWLPEVGSAVAATGCYSWTKRTAVWILRKRRMGEGLLHLPLGLKSVTLSMDLYDRWCREACSLGFRSVTYPEALTMEQIAGTRGLLLRHDIDMDPADSIPMAEVEAAHGLRSTWFVMTSGRFYDVMMHRHRKAIRHLADLGHEVGLHLDLDDDLELSRLVLEAIAGKRVEVFSQHDPTIRGLDSTSRSGWINAYSPNLVERGWVYRSDSGKRWRQEDCFGALQHRRLHMLTHPELWKYGNLDLLQMIRLTFGRRRQEMDLHFVDFMEQQLPYLKG